MLELLLSRAINATSPDPASDQINECTLSTCPLSYAFVDYVPTLGGNAFYLAAFSIFLLAQLYLGIRHRTMGFTIAMFMALFLEIFGYAGRVQMHYNPFSRDAFLEYLIALSIGPVFMAAAIYLCLSRIVVVYDPEEAIGWLKHRSYMLIFCTCDLVSLVLQAIGGAKASLADTQEETKLGTHIMVAGLSTQVASLVLFAALCLEFGLRVRKHRSSLNPKHQNLYTSKTFTYFLISLFFATLFIFIRSVFRVAELSGGFGGPLANNEVSFMVLDGAMVILASLCLTAFHPGLVFGARWQDTNFHFRRRRADAKNLEEGKGSGSGTGSGTPMDEGLGGSS